MSTSLFDALVNGVPEKKDELQDMMSGDFARKVDKYKDMIVDAYMRNAIDVNKSIARVAEKENLNDDQISRIIEEVNNQIYLLKYNQMKSSPEREVSFDIASLSKIKNILKSGEAHKPINQQKEASAIESAFKKTASWEDDNGDSLNFLNCSSYEIGSLTPELPTDRAAYLKKITLEKIASMEDEIEKDIEKIACDVYTVAETLIKYDRFNINAQEVFEQMCKQASVRKADQLMIKNAITQKVAQMQEYKLVPNEYAFNIDLVDIDKVANEFSLGQYSFMEKMATDKGSNQNVPVVVTDKKTVRSVNDLINIASDVVNQKQQLNSKQSKLEDTKSKITNSKK